MINKFAELENYIIKTNPIVACFVETHITKDIQNWEININGYEIIRVDTTSRHTGGVVVYVKENVKFEIIEIEEIDNKWFAISLKILNNVIQNCIICAIYASPKLKKLEIVTKLEKKIEYLLEFNCNIVITGDFNVDLSKKTSSAKKIENVLVEQGMIQLVEDYTRIAQVKVKNSVTVKTTRSKIDYVITNNEFKKMVTVEVLDEAISDHRPINVNISTSVNRRSGENKKNHSTIEYKDFRELYESKEISDDFKINLRERDWSANINSENLDDMLYELTKNLQSSIAEKVKVKKFKVINIYSENKWFDREVKNIQFERNQLYKLARITDEEENWNNYKAKRNEMVEVVRRKKFIYYNNIIDELVHKPRDMWKVLKKMYRGKENGKMKEVLFGNKKYTDDKEIANKFNDFFRLSIEEIIHSNVNNTSKDFSVYVQENIKGNVNNARMEKFKEVGTELIHKHVLKLRHALFAGDGISDQILKVSWPVINRFITNIVNKSLQEGKIPEDLKVSIIVPVPKICNTVDGENFRAVNTLSMFDKVLEYEARDQLNEFAMDNNIIRDYQSGFRTNHSCETAIQFVLNSWRISLSENKVVVAVFIDLKRAFEVIDRKCLIEKMKGYGFQGKVLIWISSYLDSRKQIVKFNKEMSTAKSCNFGVPQGAVLGPFFFNMFINDIGNCLQKCKIHLYADDAVIYYEGHDINEITDVVSTDLCNIEKWLDMNKLIINASKTKGMVICAPTVRFKNQVEINQIELKIKNVHIEIIKEMKYLGVIIDNELNFKSYGKEVLKKIARKVGLLRRVAGSLKMETKIKVYQAIVAPHIDFCSSVLFLLSKNFIESFQKVQNKAMRNILRVSKDTSINRMCEALGWMKVKERIVLNMLTLLFRISRDMAPNYLSKLIKNKCVKYNLRNSSKIVVDRSKNNSQDNSIFIKGIKIFNRIPNKIRDVNTTREFRRECWKSMKDGKLKANKGEIVRFWDL
jgi:hypothetical protein